MTVKK